MDQAFLTTCCKSSVRMGRVSLLSSFAGGMVPQWILGHSELFTPAEPEAV